MKCQQKNIENLKENIHFSYEDFTGDPETVCRKIVEFMPELGDMDLKTKLKSHYREEKVKNYNDIQILNLNSNDIKKINSVLHSSRDIMGYFKYQYIEPGLLRDFNYAAFRCYNLVKRMIKKLAFRRVGAYTVYKKK